MATKPYLILHRRGDFDGQIETIARLPGGLSEQIAIKGRNAW